ncbi:hypothetical protein INT47_010116, partial [Mucor saturninus]
DGRLSASASKLLERGSFPLSSSSGYSASAPKFAKPNPHKGIDLAEGTKLRQTIIRVESI